MGFSWVYYSIGIHLLYLLVVVFLRLNDDVSQWYGFTILIFRTEHKLKCDSWKRLISNGNHNMEKKLKSSWLNRKRIKKTIWTMNFSSTDVWHLAFVMAHNNGKETEQKPRVPLFNPRIENNNLKNDVWFSWKTMVNFSIRTILLDMHITIFIQWYCYWRHNHIYCYYSWKIDSVWTSFYHFSGLYHFIRFE